MSTPQMNRFFSGSLGVEVVRSNADETLVRRSEDAGATWVAVANVPRSSVDVDDLYDVPEDSLIVFGASPDGQTIVVAMAAKSSSATSDPDRALFYSIRADSGLVYAGQQGVPLQNAGSAGLSVYTNAGDVTLVVGDRVDGSTNNPYVLHVVNLDAVNGTLSLFSVDRPSEVQARFDVVAAVASAGTVLVSVVDSLDENGESHFVLVRSGGAAVHVQGLDLHEFAMPLVPVDVDAFAVETTDGLTFQVAQYTVPPTSGPSVRTPLGTVTVPTSPSAPAVGAALGMTPDGLHGLLMIAPASGPFFVYRTSDGGSTWALMETPIANLGIVVTMDVANARALVTGNAGAVITIPFLAVPCFAGSTPLRLRSGAYVRADAVKAGHVLALADGGSARVRAVVRSHSARLVVVPPHAAGVDCPSRAVGLTPNHRVRNAKGAIVRADQLGLPVLALDSGVPVYHVCLDAYAWLDAAGLVSESCAWTPEQLRQRARAKRSRAAKLDLPKASPCPGSRPEAVSTVLEHAPAVEVVL